MYTRQYLVSKMEYQGELIPYVPRYSRIHSLHILETPQTNDYKHYQICNFMLEGKVHTDIIPLLYGAGLTALHKKQGGIRPAGNTYRRLVAKLGCKYAAHKLQEYLQPTQLGFNTRLGGETGAHAARKYYTFEHTTTKVLIKVDYYNAFNTVERQTLLDATYEKLPSLYPFIKQCYGTDSHLFWNTNIISSQRGVQQGDPLGPPLFCLALHPIINSIHQVKHLVPRRWYHCRYTRTGFPSIFTYHNKII